MKRLRYVMSREELNGKYSIMIERCKGNEFKEKNNWNIVSDVNNEYYVFASVGYI